MRKLGQWISRSTRDWFWIGGAFAVVSAVVLLVIEFGLITTIEYEFRAPVTERLINKNVQWGAPVFIRIFKEESELELWAKKMAATFCLRPIRFAAGRARSDPSSTRVTSKARRVFTKSAHANSIPTASIIWRSTSAFPMLSTKLTGAPVHS